MESQKPVYSIGYVVLTEAGISGAHASSKRLHHGFGVRAAKETRNPRLVQKMLGHANLETTAICMDVMGLEAREGMALTW